MASRSDDGGVSPRATNLIRNQLSLRGLGFGFVVFASHLYNDIFRPILYPCPKNFFQMGIKMGIFCHCISEISFSFSLFFIIFSLSVFFFGYVSMLLASASSFLVLINIILRNINKRDVK